MNDILDSFDDQKAHLQEEVLRIIEKQRRTYNHLKQKLLECQEWKSAEKEGLLLQANLYKVSKGQKEVVVEDWDDGSQKTLILEGRTLEESLKRIFSKAKRLKRGQDSVKIRILEIEKRLENLQRELLAIESAEGIKELLPFLRKKSVIPSKEEKKKLPYREYRSTTGYRILVGKSQKDNDELTFRVGTPHDIWLHANDFPGSHVIIKLKGREEPDNQTIEEAALLAINASGAKDKPEADVVIARQKHLKRFKGRPGQVMVGVKSVRRIVVDKEKLALILKAKI